MSNMRGSKSGNIKVFCVDGKSYARKGYEMFGTDVVPYEDGEISFLQYGEVKMKGANNGK